MLKSPKTTSFHSGHRTAGRRRRRRVAPDGPASRSPSPATAASPVPTPVGLPATPHGPLEGVFAGLIPELRHAISQVGYRTPTPIQEQAIPYLLDRRDLLGCAQTGTGKTAAFALPLLQHLHASKRRAQPRRPLALILAPTRELAAQIGDSIRDYALYMPIRHITIFGGVSQVPQANALRGGVDIVVATPGRLIDLMGQGLVELGAIEFFVLDEADRMLDMGFLPDIRRVLRVLPSERQSLLFSATMPEPILRLAADIVRTPQHITIDPEQPAVTRIAQKVFFVDKGDKLELLTGMLRDGSKAKVLVFAQMKHAANRISKRLSAEGISAAAIHGNKSQGARTRALADFKSGSARVLVATDIAARGLDVAGISHVINFDVPIEAETYVHRIGRTARAGADGAAVSFCCAEERGQLRAIERLLRQSVPVDTNHALHSEAACHESGGDSRPPTYRRKSFRRR